MNTNLQTATGPTDEQLWRLACDGDRDAFTGIVRRYQSLICSITYSACGALGIAEDMAQETFITAWTRIRDLREPGRLRQWLCGIARNITANAVRRDLRHRGEPQPLDAAEAEPSDDADPAALAITREEETLLWRTLADMPASYREPLILFYREDQSIAEVALQLDLTEDTVKQRLSRGRAMLREEVAAVVESTLARTKPGMAFTIGVLAALPMLTASTATAALTAQTAIDTGAAAAGKGLLAKLGFGALIGPAIGLLCAYLGTRAAASAARSDAERRCILRYSRQIIAFCFLMSIGLVAVLSQAGKLYSASAAGIVVGVTAWTAALVGGIILVCQRLDREVRRIRIQTNTSDEAYASVLTAQGRSLRLPKYFETNARLLGVPLVAIAWGGCNADRYRARAVYGWLAVGDIAVSPFLAVGGVAVAPIAIGAITVGVFSLSIFWGVAVGVLAVGSLGFGWWALGCAAAGIKCAVGFAAVARDYAFGIAATAANTGRAAREWIATQALSDFTNVILHQAHWWILLCVALALGLRWLRSHGRAA